MTKTSASIRSSFLRSTAVALVTAALAACGADDADALDDAPGTTAVAHAEEAFPGVTGTPARVTVGARHFEAQVIDGLAIAEGDIELGRASEVVDGAAGARTASRTNTDARWATGLVPYVIDPTIGATQRADILSAIDHWNASTVFYLYPRGSEGDYLAFVPGDGCSSPVGRQGGRQEIHLARGCGRGATIHEIGHSMGLWHEQSRDDRDSNVRVHWGNIEDGQAYNFKTYVEAGDDGQSPWGFDFGSIMLYDSYAFSKNGQPTLTRTDGSTYTTNRTALSPLDINGVTRFLTHTVGVNVFFELRIGNGECLSTLGDARNVHAGLVTRSCDGSLAQRFYWFNLPTINDLRLVHYLSGMCMDIPNASTANNVASQIFPCHGYDNQAFTFQPAAVSQTSLMKLRHSGKCLARNATGSTGGAPVLQEPCDASSPLQQWRIVVKL